MPWEDLLSLAPGTGLGGAVIGLFAWTVKMSREDRAEYRAALRAAAQDAREVLEDHRARANADRDTADAEIADLRRRLADTQTVAELERAARRDAESRSERLEAKLTVTRERLADAQKLPVDGKDPA